MEVTTSYLELGLRMGRHIDGLVDAYYGPPELAQQVEAEEVRGTRQARPRRSGAPGGD